jgi:hypothetical protein
MKVLQEELDAVSKLFDGKRTAQNISDHLGIKLQRVYYVYKILGIDASIFRGARIKEIPTHKICKKCDQDKLIDCFRGRENKNKGVNNIIYYESYCKDCEKIASLKRFKKSASWESRKNNHLSKIRSNVSRSVRSALHNLDKSKNGSSVLKYLKYTVEELKEYLESKFEPWMNWNNYGKYTNKTWNDSDSSTWTWQIDHIIPQSDLPYESMEHPNFQKCWALENLRPLSSKENLIDGVKRTRHKTTLSIAA